MISIFNGSTRGLSNPLDHATYIQVHHKILKHLHLFGSSDWLVFTALALHMDTNGFCFPSIDAIGRMTGLSTPTVRRCLKSLVEIRIEGMRVLAVRDRYDTTGRQTSNGYILFPDSDECVKTNTHEDVKTDIEEDLIFDGEEGIRIDTPYNYNHKELEPKVTKSNRSRSKKVSTIKLPGDTDPGRHLYEAYRSAVFPELDPANFNIAEWTGARHVVYQMHHKEITPSDVHRAASNLVSKWNNNRDLVTIHSLWKHWSTATTGKVVPIQEGKVKSKSIEDIGTQAMDVFRKVAGVS